MPAKKKQNSLKKSTTTTSYKVGGELPEAQLGNLGRLLRTTGKPNLKLNKNFRAYSPQGSSSVIQSVEKARLAQAIKEAQEAVLNMNQELPPIPPPIAGQNSAFPLDWVPVID